MLRYRGWALVAAVVLGSCGTEPGASRRSKDIAEESLADAGFDNPSVDVSFDAAPPPTITLVVRYRVDESEVAQSEEATRAVETVWQSYDDSTINMQLGVSVGGDGCPDDAELPVSASDERPRVEPSSGPPIGMLAIASLMASMCSATAARN